MTVFTNLLSNPGMEATSGTVEVRRNLASDPRATAALVAQGAAGWRTTRWGGPGSPSISHAFLTGRTDGPEVAPGVKITSYLRKTWNASPTGNQSSGVDNTTGSPDNPVSVPGDGLPVTAGSVYRVSSHLRPSSAGKTLQMVTAFLDAAGAKIGTSSLGPIMSPGAGEWVKISSDTLTAPAGAVRMIVTSQVAGGTPLWAPTDTLDGTGLLIEVSTVALPYFDGSFSPDSDLTASWTGAANASPSVLTGVGVAGVFGGPSRALVSSRQWAASGARSLRIIPTGNAAEGGGANVHGFPAGDVGKTFTLVATCRLSAPQTGAIDSRARRAVLLTPDVVTGPQAPNIAGSHEIRWTFTVAAAGQTLRLVGGATAGGGDVWWDSVALIEGEYTGPAFDGDTASTTDRVYAWTGPANSSPSTSTPTVQVALVGAGTPRDVQIVIPGLIAGERYAVEGVADGFTWPVRGGKGTSDGTTLVLGDTMTPLNAPVTYRVTVNGTLRWTSDPIVVAAPGKYILQSLDGRMVAAPTLMSNGLPRSLDVRTAAFSIPGRARPVVRMDATGDGGGHLLLDTTGSDTRDLYDLLAAGRPIVIRTDGDVRDMAPVDVALITDASSVLTDARIQDGDTRRWTITYLLIDDPDPNAVLALSTWDDFDAVYAGQTWSAFDTQWSSSTWDDFDRFDWEGQA